jgi:hypothetical protein
MAPQHSTSNTFVLQAFDLDQWCPVLQAKFEVPELTRLREILEVAADDDPGLSAHYRLAAHDLAAIRRQYGVELNVDATGVARAEISLFRQRNVLSRVPFLIHTNYELPLLLEGRKKLAKMYYEYPPMRFPGEERFDRWVHEGLLYKEVDVEPFDRSIKGFEGVRTVYYTPKGEEWRVPAMKLIYRAAGQSGGWNEHFERLEGMLFGYEDWQNNWWIENGLKKGGFSGLALCCPVTSAGLAWIAAAGFRALPPIDKPTLPLLAVFGEEEADDLRTFMLQDADSVALVRFNVYGKALTDIIDIREAGPWLFPADRIPDLNRNLLRSLTIIDRRSTV